MGKEKNIESARDRFIYLSLSCIDKDGKKNFNRVKYICFADVSYVDEERRMDILTEKERKKKNRSFKTSLPVIDLFIFVSRQWQKKEKKCVSIHD